MLAVLGGAWRAFGQRVVLGSFVGLWLHIKIDGVQEYSGRLSQILVSRIQRKLSSKVGTRCCLVAHWKETKENCCLDADAPLYFF